MRVRIVNVEVCRRIFERKGRSTTKPLALVMPSNAAVAARFSLSAEARRLAEGLWPGDLALLLLWSCPEVSREQWWLDSPAAMVTRDPWLLGKLAVQPKNPRRPPSSAAATRRIPLGGRL